MITQEEKKLIKNLDSMTQAQLIKLDPEALCLNIRQLIHIIRNMDLISVQPVGPQVVLRVDSSLPPDNIVIADEEKRAGRSYI